MASASLQGKSTDRFGLAWRSRNSTHQPKSAAATKPPVHIASGVSALCEPATRTHPAASSSTRLGLWFSVSEGPNRCSLWNWPPATSRAPPAMVQSRIISPTAGDVP